MICFWDMDFTLVNNDCDVSWKKFLVDKGIASSSAMTEADFFYQQYLDGCLNINDFIKFQLAEFKQYNKKDIQGLCQEHFNEVIKPQIFPTAEKMIRHQLQNKNIVCLITATNNYIAQPLADFLNIQYVKATKVEEDGQVFTGNFIEPYCYGLNKIKYMKELIQELRLAQDTAITYYGDSINDIPIFKWVDEAFVINPQGKLLTETQVHNWNQLHF